MMPSTQEARRSTMVTSDQKRMDHNNIRGFIQSKIENHRVVIFSKSWCPYCFRTKALFSKIMNHNHNNINNDLDIEIVELDTMEEQGLLIQEELYQMTG